MKKSRLRADPAKVRAWQQRSRKPLKRPEVPLKRSAVERASVPRVKASRLPAPLPGALTAGEWRRAVWEADEGRCVGCGKAVPRDADRWVWQAHHPIPKQRLKARGLHHLVHDVRFGVVTCKRCHERHESATCRIPGARIPQRVHVACVEIGPWAADALDLLHPAARRMTSTPEDDA